MVSNTLKIGQDFIKILISKIRRSKYLVAIFLLIAVLNIVFQNTYPLNVAAQDNPNYLSMILSKASNLMHASGYPYVMILGSELVGISGPSTIFTDNWHLVESEWYDQLQNLQIGIHLLIMFGCLILSAKNFGKLAASIMLVFWGSSILFMSSVGSAAPEWLQGDVLLLCMLICSTAYISESIPSKVVLYTLGFAILTFSYLIKYNSLLFYPIIAMMIALDIKKFAWKFSTIVLGITCSIGIVTLYISYFHYPTTQSKKLNFDHAWVLTAAMPNDYFRKPLEETGIFALRWRALNALLPPDYFRAGAFCCIDSGAKKDERDKYRAAYNRIMTASRETLTDFIETHEARSEFNNFTSSIPLYWYIGLAETDKLGIAVFRESISKVPGYYILKILNGALTVSMVDKQIVPFMDSPLGLNLQHLKDDEFIHTEIENGARGTTYLYWNPSESIWKPGIIFFEHLNKLTRHRLLEISLVLISLIGIALIRNRKILKLQLINLFSIAIFFSASLTLLSMRQKELVSIFPIITVFFGISFSYIFNYFSRLFTPSIALTRE